MTELSQCRLDKADLATKYCYLQRVCADMNKELAEAVVNVLEMKAELARLRSENAELRETLETVVREARIARAHVVPPLQPGIAENLDDAIDIGLKALATV